MKITRAALRSNNGIQIKQSGFSLLELMISIACCSLITLMSIPALLMILNGGRMNRETVDMEENNKMMSMILPNYIGQAINVDWTSFPIVDISGDRGQILNFTSQYSPVADPLPITVGVFLREAGHPSTATAYGDIRAVALYFKNPSLTTAGEFTISSSPQNVGQVVLNSDQFEYRVGSLVGLKVSPGGYHIGDNTPVRVVQVEMVYRKFLTADASLWHWCPEDSLGEAGCDTGVSFKDIKKTIHISLVNNSIETSDFISGTNIRRKENLYGNLYFFGLTVVR